MFGIACGIGGFLAATDKRRQGKLSTREPVVDDQNKRNAETIGVLLEQRAELQRHRAQLEPLLRAQERELQRTKRELEQLRSAQDGPETTKDAPPLDTAQPVQSVQIVEARPIGEPESEKRTLQDEPATYDGLASAIASVTEAPGHKSTVVSDAYGLPVVGRGGQQTELAALCGIFAGIRHRMMDVMDVDGRSYRVTVELHDGQAVSICVDDTMASPFMLATMTDAADNHTTGTLRQALVSVTRSLKATGSKKNSSEDVKQA